MSKRWILILILIPCLFLLSSTSQAAQSSDNAQVLKLIQAHACTACHTTNVKRIGPPWSWVAWRYQGKKSKQASIAEVANFIISGGTGYWAKWTGGIPMPAHPKISVQQARAIAMWILAHPPAKPPKVGG